MSPKRVFIDVETRSRVDIRKTGGSAYSTHPSTQLLLLVYHTDDCPGEYLHWRPGAPFPAALIKAINHGYEFHAHNAAFERAIWANVMVPKHNAPPIPLKRWHCTAARCAAAGLPRSLDDASKALGLSELKDSEGHKLMLRMCKPRKPSKNNPSLWVDDEESMSRLAQYCEQDVRTEMAVHNATPDLSEYERYIWLLDQKINDRGVPIDIDSVEFAIGISSHVISQINGTLERLTEGEVDAITKGGALLDWLNARGVNIDTLDQNQVDAALAGDLPKDCRVALELRKEGSKTSLAKLRAMWDRVEHDGRVRGVHLYHGSHTGRWSGSGVQFQNVPRPSMAAKDIDKAFNIMPQGHELFSLVYDRPLDTLVSSLRGMVQAQTGRFLVSDFAGIEARKLAWLAAQDNMVLSFASGKDLYVEMAEQIGEGATRFLGKVAILGLGYGMGKKKFRKTAELWGMPVSQELADRAVDTYRYTYSRIPGLWSACERAAFSAIQNPGYAYPASEKIWFAVRGDYLDCKLPSGRVMHYYQPKIEERPTSWGELRDSITYMGRNSFTTKWERLSTWGGSLVENICQASCRDLLAAAMFRLEQAGYPVVFHVHDEVVIEREGGSIDEVNEIMAELPPWAAGLPVAAEGYESERYRK